MTLSRARLRSGTPVYGIMLQEFEQLSMLRLAAHAGYDFVVIDMEHGAYDFKDVARLAFAARAAGVSALVRPPDLAYPWIARALDAGAVGLMIPRVREPEQIRDVLRAMKYPPIGERGISGRRGHSDYLPVDRLAFAERMNNENILIVQIELDEAVGNIDKLLSVPGIDVALIGPADLSLSLGVGGESHPRLQQAMHKVVDACKRHGVRSGLQTGDVQQLRLWAKAGVQVLIPGTDIALMAGALREKLVLLRD